MGTRIVITENQYKRLFLGEQRDSRLDKHNYNYNVYSKRNNVLVLPEANAGQIQEFLKKKGFYGGEIDYDFADKSAESFAKYYYGSNSNIKTISELYDKLKKDGYDVGSKSGKLFGPKMAKVIADLIKNKETKSGDKVIQTSEKCESVCNKMSEEEMDEWAVWWTTRNEQYPTVDTYRFWNNSAEKMSLNNRQCMACHSVYGVGGLVPTGRWQEMQTAVKYNPSLKNSTQYKEMENAINHANVLYKQIRPWNEIVYYYRHDIIDALAVIAYFFGPIGIGISIGLEAINGGLYAAEGDWTSAILSWIFMALPATGPLVRRLTAPVVKNIVKYWKKVANLQKNMGKSEKVVKEEIEKAFNSLSKTEKEIVHEMSDDKVIKTIKDGNKKEARKIVKDNIKSNPELYKNYKIWEQGWGKNSKFLYELLNPTVLEKILYPTIMGGMLYLNHSGKLTIAVDWVMDKLVEMGILDDASEETKKQMETYLNDTLLEPYKNIDFNSIPPEERADILGEVYVDMDTTIYLLDTLPKNFAGVDELINLPLDKKLKIKDRIDNLNLPENLKTFTDEFKWAVECQVNGKIMSTIELTPEIISHLEDKAGNHRNIKNSNLGSNYEYSSWDGYWFYKKSGSDNWVLVTNCNANIKIESELDKKLDPDIDTPYELFDKYDDIIDIKDINFFDGQ